MGSSQSSDGRVSAVYMDAYRNIKQSLDANTRMLDKISNSVNQQEVRLDDFQKRLRNIEHRQISANSQPPSPTKLNDGQLNQVIWSITQELPDQMKSALKGSKMSLDAEVEKLKDVHQRMMDTGVGCISTQVFSVLSHLLRKVDELKETDSILVQKVSQFEVNLDILNSRQLRYSKDLKKFETGLLLVQNLVSEEIPSDRQQNLFRSSEENVAGPDSASTGQGKPMKAPDKNRQDSAPKGYETAKGMSSSSQNSNQRSRPRAKSRPRNTEELSKGMDLEIYRFNSLVGTGKCIFSPRQSFAELGGNFRGHARFCKDNNLALSLIFEPDPDLEDDDFLDLDQQFSYALKIASKDKSLNDWFLAAGTKSLQQLRQSKWGKGNGLHLYTGHCDKVKQYLSGETLLITFGVTI